MKIANAKLLLVVQHDTVSFNTNNSTSDYFRFKYTMQPITVEKYKGKMGIVYNFLKKVNNSERWV